MAFSDFFKNIFKSKAKTDKPDTQKIYKTTDGYLGGDSKNKKPRHVVVVDQRVDDGALAVSKIHSKEGKKEKNRHKKAGPTRDPGWGATYRPLPK